jgi:hypothetical protein
MLNSSSYETEDHIVIVKLTSKEVFKMAEKVDKTSIIIELNTSYNKLEEILAALSKTQYFIEGVIPGWSVKDILAHITSWHQRLLKWLDAAVRNEEPAISGPDTVEEMDALNAQFYQANKSLPLDEVLLNFRTTYQYIKDIVETMPVEDLISTHRFAWTKGQPLWQSIAGDTYEHYQEHILQIQEWIVRSRQVD